MIRNLIEHTKYYCHGKLSNEDGIGRCTTLTPNGPAVCFSRRNPTTAPGRIMVPRPASGGRATKLSRCKEGLARVFAVMVLILLRSGAIAVQFGTEPRTYHRLQNWLGALAQCRGTKLIEARKLSRYTEL